MDSVYTESLNKLIEQFATLPGIGKKTAERLAYHILMTETSGAMALADAISGVKNNIKRCSVCGNLAEDLLCSICSDSRRDKSLVCVVEQPKDIISLERTGNCNWVYHVLDGHIAPLDGVEPEHLNINSLIERLRKGDISEVVMATNPNIAGDGTTLYLSSLIRPLGVKMTRLARGLPAGTTIEYANDKMLTDAIIGRQSLQ